MTSHLHFARKRNYCINCIHRRPWLSMGPIPSPPLAVLVAYQVFAFWIGNCQKLELAPFETCCPTSRQPIANRFHHFGCVPVITDKMQLVAHDNPNSWCFNEDEGSGSKPKSCLTLARPLNLPHCKRSTPAAHHNCQLLICVSGPRTY